LRNLPAGNPVTSFFVLVASLAVASILFASVPARAGGSEPIYRVSHDQAGRVATFQPGGPVSHKNAFFQALGTNGRACVTCHPAHDGFGLSASTVRERFNKTAGKDPIFRLVDGATCPTDDVSTKAARERAYGLLLSKGLIRIALPIPAQAEFSVTAVDDPYGCTQVTSPSDGVLSVYRRPLRSTNLAFSSSLMWDGREPSLQSQATDATFIHFQAAAPPTGAQISEIVSFESGLYTAQVSVHHGGNLLAHGASGGPRALSLADFYIGINDPFGANPTGALFDPNSFTTYDAWLDSTGGGKSAMARASVARGEDLFNNLPFSISGVRGFNDTIGQDPLVGTCSTCHDTPNVGNHSTRAFFDLGLTDATQRTPDLPLFALHCDSGPLAGQTFYTSDPGAAMTTGRCADIATFKTPVLRGLAAHSPYFHDGSRDTLRGVVDFYDMRFGLGLSEQQKADMVAFLASL
jgi:cytochrome c peroxidase